MGQLEGQLDHDAQKPVLGAVAPDYCRLLAPADWTAAQRAALEETAQVASLRLPLPVGSCQRCRSVGAALSRCTGCPDSGHPAAFCSACLHHGALFIGNEDAAVLALLWCPGCNAEAKGLSR